ncbi:hypothetical protein AC579_182 [Pseudocercospora musae]|uniref:PD-(D/E)XK nuclease-like domain-containing protein n=1 Tax=Pseudocercospora musae TaxID=113226 RepID=A0A139I122_9PEZI|nr:hypothetical protein AC579_182 [Pseudocercospora musae]
MWNISAWLDDVENTPPVEAQGTKRKRDGEIASTEKRPRLAPMDANTNTNTGRESPRKSARNRKVPPMPIFEDDAAAAARPPPPSTPRARSTAGAAVSGHQEGDAMLGAEEETPRNRPTERFQTMHFPAPRQPDSVSQSSKSSAYTSRSKSPVKDIVDLQMADAPIFQFARWETPLPKCVYPLIHGLEDIADGNGVVPAIAKVGNGTDRKNSDMCTVAYFVRQEATESEFGRFRSRWEAEIPHPSDERDMMDLLDIAKDARQLESSNQAEAAWNSEAHSPILRVALRGLHGRVTHFNVTQARPIPEFLPTRGPRSAEARLVDYAIAITPTPHEERHITHLLRKEPDYRSTISQSRATALRTHPIAISIETKADSGSTSEAKNQLGVWAFAHFQRIRTLLGLEEEDVALGEECIMAVHPVIYVQQHDWIMALMVARKGWTEFAEIDLKLRIGGTGSLLELWKLRASLRCLGQWAEEQYWPAMYEKMKAVCAR